MGESIRKNISMTEETFKTINDYAKRKGMNFSEFLTDSALKVINQEDTMDILGYLNSHCDFASLEEQKEFDSMNINLDNTEGEGITINELLQD